MITLIVISIVFMMLGLIRFSYLLAMDRETTLNVFDRLLVAVSSVSAFVFCAILAYAAFLPKI